ncbi:GNAT family N-acetyltransferase [Lysinibacillus sp. NPDC097162]|uniref:GNAT family N-acetyltransferase n=1 Tax=Lysinibacillus sp. NPDC097162 TaxID=3364140 RepID=UPI00381B97F0
MILVPKEHYSLIKNKLEDAPTFVFSVLDSTIEGTVYADCADYESLLIQTDLGLYYITGHTIDELLIKNLIKFFEASVNQAKRFTLFSGNSSWDQAIEKCLNKHVGKIQRYAYSFDAMKYKSRRRIDNCEYDVAKIDPLDIQHCLEFDKKYYDEYWDSTDNFIQNGIGFCVKDRGKIISECVSIFKSSKYAEIDIVTDLNYRGKGLAGIVAEQFIDYCLAETIQPRWDCDVDNSASINLGSKLGFTNARKYSIYFKNSQNVQR